MSGYYEDKPLSQVCGSGSGPTCLAHSVFTQMDAQSAKIAQQKGDLLLVKQTPGPRDLDGRVGELQLCHLQR